jgi:methoxymalonate biosynthesis acyl carrier protein
MSAKAVNLERLRTLLLEHLHVEVPSADADLLETGVLDSLQLVDLLLLIERHFGRRIPVESIDLDNLRTLSSLARLVGEAEPAASHHALGVVQRGAKPT